MKFNYKFQHILTLREQEKEETFTLYGEAVRQFEHTAKQLYELLKKKETLELYQTEKLASGFSIQKIRHNQLFINNLTNTIDYWQNQVIAARNEMQYWESQLLEKNIEVKKYEAMRDKSLEAFMQALRESENNEQDEIATMQYFHRKGN